MAHQRLVKDQQLLDLKHQIFDQLICSVEKIMEPIEDKTYNDRLLDDAWNILTDCFPDDIHGDNSVKPVDKQ